MKAKESSNLRSEKKSESLSSDRQPIRIGPVKYIGKDGGMDGGISIGMVVC